MASGILLALGGLGVFLFGMSVMTGALRSLADERIRGILAGTVDGRFRGVVTGAVSTAILQSSSATTVAAVGLVGAGLMTFSQSLGVIFGANVGTTATGWLVATIGLKFDLGLAMMPLIFVGTLLRIVGRRTVAEVGTAVVGFGLIFVGIGFLKGGLAGLEGWLTPDVFPPDTLGGRVLLVLIGVVITIVTQSSSAGVATALAAVHAGTISLNQAAAIVIGMDVGTTATAALATLGGNVQARRTGFAHVIYNTLTGAFAFLMLTPFMRLAEGLSPGIRASDPELVLVAFHTTFNVVGVIGVLPFTKRFANLVMWIVPDRGNPLTRQLDPSLIVEPRVALGAVRSTLWNVLGDTLRALDRSLHNPADSPDDVALDDVDEAISGVRSYLDKVAERIQGDTEVTEYVSLLHVLDHIGRLVSRLRERRRLSRCRDEPALAEMSDELGRVCAIFLEDEPPLDESQLEQVRASNRQLKSAMRRYRVRILKRTADKRVPASVATARMDTARTLRRLGYHLWRIAIHFAPVANDVSQQNR